MKKILLILLLGIAGFIPESVCAADVQTEQAETPKMENVQLDMRDYDEVEVPAGTFIPVVSAQEISTQYCPVGYKVRFTSTNDLYMKETNIIPQNTEFYGYIEKLNEPVVGTNASMTIKISKMILPDGFEVTVKAYIYTSNNNLIGGEMSAPAEWIKMPHYQSKIGNNTTLQIRPGRARKLGEHTVIKSGEDRLIILTDTAYITHTLTN